ncbi:DNA-binding protein [Paenibacillus polymyxa]|uniref:DNA-binding protein n=1 Tax=Paenibacillus TaxID=44249 RepID=UPI0004DF2112|nr:DNA-binding protein [Paenibacillus polymyxa]MBY7738436.1 DNA-binding protein [Paenibacillus polymyxa]MDN4079246.1 DNA-binding protein [Paenibacillus polymyxa]MDN4104665.1 DNA-binding protein [Paenibacillus polymyxa]
MENATTIRSEIEKELKLGGYTFNSFGQATGLNRGIFSAMLNGNPPKPISVRQMDLITKALNYHEDWLYDLYVDECFYDGRPHWKRVKPFLIRCVEVGNLQCVEKVLSRLMEDLNHIPTIFALAEELYDGGKLQEAIPFYECVIENEKYQHSERLAISHYKLFVASIGQDLERNLEAVLRFIPYRNRLPENYHLDALLKLANIYFSLHQWKEVERYADELRNLATTVYKNEIQKRKNINKYRQLETERPLVVYYGQGYLLKGNALELQGMYEKAMEYINGYADLGWFEGLDELGLEEVELLKLWAEANKLNLRVLMGEKGSLLSYVNFLKRNPLEVLPGLLTIVESAIKHKFSIDAILSEFSEEIRVFNDSFFLDSGYYQLAPTVDRYADLHYKLSIYYFGSKRINQGLDSILESLKFYKIINNKTKFVECVALFERFRKDATSQHRKDYEFIMEEILNDEKINDVLLVGAKSN